MATDKLILNTAHSAGRTFLAFSRDGNVLYTGGADTLVRVWKADSGADHEPETALEADEPITALGVDNDGWLSGSEDSHVRRYLKTRTEMESLIARANAIPIRYIAADPKGRRVAIASDETVVKVIDLDDTTKVQLLEGHKKGVRSATWHPSGSLVTTCSSDGKIIAWDLSEDEPKIEKTLEGIIPAVNDNESAEFGHECAAVWHPSGMYFVVATKAHEIITVSRSTWSKISSFTNEDCLGATTALAISSNGVYLASACNSGVFIWSTQTRRVVARQSLPQNTTIHSLAFSSTHNLLAWTDNSGNLTRWPNAVPISLPSPTKPVATNGMSIPMQRRPDTSALFLDDAADAAEGDDGGDVNLDVDAGGLDEHDEDWIIDDLGDGLKESGEKEYGLREMVSVTKAQAAFQPGSTPFQNKRRYISFNNIGVAEVVDQDTHQIINVEFHDQTTRKNYHFTDSYKFDMASIGERGVVYACPPEGVHPARVHYKPYATWASLGEWTYELPNGERAIAIAAGGTPPTRSLRVLQEADAEGNGYVVIATDRGVVRFFSGGGAQRGPVWAIDGDIIAMVAGRDYVFVVHREGGTSLDGNQNLKYTLRTSDTFRVMHTGRLPVNRGQTLKWLGITDEGAPVIYDSVERIMMLEHYRFTAQGSWVVLLDATQLARRDGKDEAYWPIGVTGSTLMTIILKGREAYPGFPRPLAQEIEMQMPYLDMDSPEAQKEERVARETILLDHLRDTLEEDELTTEDISKTELDLDKELIQLIQLACKHDRLQRALDAAKLLHHTASIDMAIKVADFYHLAGLREKFNVLKRIRVGADRLRDERARRSDWKAAAGAVPPARDPYAAAEADAARRPFQDTRPAPAVDRPRLATAAPSAEPSPFARRPTQQQPPIVPSSSSRTVVDASPPPEKRKRAAVDENEESIASTSDANPKRRAVGFDEDASSLKPSKYPSFSSFI
ncbi:WD40 repeat-like protein [Fomitiporia mediterranea MF3/22]|uniref:WD40 repeat-like protein n=1 Tax=Fomitiporia mediterranea (strain MF3/22) TaxID=694068 RepID=UPI00044084E3|nr:WD40 repeat-like protein [Fomitiporia mediterranea MF3/22]EJD03058.1 WD40 repeat-like protein [Fomitiporia mediterranea MF3/22]